MEDYKIYKIKDKSWANIMSGHLVGCILLFAFCIPVNILGDTSGNNDSAIRCYCNAASCVSTGYMCKSSTGNCFTQLSHEAGSDVTRSQHGCAELLPLPDRNLCSGKEDTLKTHSSGGDWPVLLCCREDMCNYMDIDESLYQNTAQKNGSLLKGVYGGRGTLSEYVPGVSRESTLWFKAAVIAVPIAGGFILLLLVMLAVRLLRQDAIRHQQLLAYRRHRNLAKTQLYVADHFCDKHYNCGVTDKAKHMSYHYCDVMDSKMYCDVSNRCDIDKKDLTINFDGHQYKRMSEPPLQFKCESPSQINNMLPHLHKCITPQDIQSTRDPRFSESRSWSDSGVDSTAVLAGTHNDVTSQVPDIADYGGGRVASSGSSGYSVLLMGSENGSVSHV